MLKWSLIAMAITASGCQADAGVGPDEIVPDSTWTLVWADEFDGTSLDLSKWSAQIGDGCDIDLCGWGNNEGQWYRADNAQVGGGLLRISARREAAGSKSYTSARLRTLGTGDFTYGRVDVRARLPRGQGIWPAVWMLPSDNAYGPWPMSGEIDIVELVGHEPNRVHGTLHYGGPGPAHVYSGADFTLSSGTSIDIPANLACFHVFTVEWEEGEIRWYVDGRHYQTQTEWHSTGGPYPAPFNRRFHLVMNVAVGGNWPGYPDETTVFPQHMDIDYVRVYQKR